MIRRFLDHITEATPWNRISIATKSISNSNFLTQASLTVRTQLAIPAKVKSSSDRRDHQRPLQVFPACSKRIQGCQILLKLQKLHFFKDFRIFSWEKPKVRACRIFR